MANNAFFILAKLQTSTVQTNSSGFRTNVTSDYGYRVLNYGAYRTATHMTGLVKDMEDDGYIKNCSFQEMLALNGTQLNYTLDGNGVATIDGNYSLPIGLLTDSGKTADTGLTRYAFSLTSQRVWCILAEKYDENGQLAGYILVDPYGKLTSHTIKKTVGINDRLINAVVKPDGTISPRGKFVFDHVGTTDISVAPTIGTSSLTENGTSAFTPGATIDDLPTIEVMGLDETDIIPKEYTSASRKMQNAFNDLRRIAPYYWNPLSVVGLVPVDDENVCSTLGVSETKLYYNVDFVLEITDGELLFILMHEASHILLSHVVRGRSKKAELYNVAADLYINTMLCNQFKLRPPEIKSANVTPITGGNPVVVTAPDFGVFQYSVKKQIDLERDTAESIYDSLLIENPQGVSNIGAVSSDESIGSVLDELSGLLNQAKQEFPDLAQQCDLGIQAIDTLKQPNSSPTETLQAVNTLNNTVASVKAEVNKRRKEQALNAVREAVKEILDEMKQLGVDALSEVPTSEMQSAVQRLNNDIAMAESLIQNENASQISLLGISSQLKADADAIESIRQNAQGTQGSQPQGQQGTQSGTQGTSSQQGTQNGQQGQQGTSSQQGSQAQQGTQGTQGGQQGSQGTQSGQQGTQSGNQQSSQQPQSNQSLTGAKSVAHDASQAMSAIRQIMNGVYRLNGIPEAQTIRDDITQICESIANDLGEQI